VLVCRGHNQHERLCNFTSVQCRYIEFLVGVKLGQVYLCRVAGNTVILCGKWHSVSLQLFSTKQLFAILNLLLQLFMVTSFHMGIWSTLLYIVCMGGVLIRSELKRQSASTEDAYWQASKRQTVETREPTSSSYGYNMYNSGSRWLF